MKFLSPSLKQLWQAEEVRWLLPFQRVVCVSVFRASHLLHSLQLCLIDTASVGRLRYKKLHWLRTSWCSKVKKGR